MARGTTLRNVRVDEARWTALGEAAKSDGLDRSTVIRALIDEYLNDEHFAERVAGHAARLAE